MIFPNDETAWYRLFWSKWFVLFAIFDLVKIALLYCIWKARG